MRVRIVVVILAACSAVATHALLARGSGASSPDALCIKSPRYAPDVPGAQPHKRGIDLGRAPQWCPIPELADTGVDDA